MTAMPFELPVVAKMHSPLARLLQRIALWQEARHLRAYLRVSLAETPESLRRDIGLDGGAPLQRSHRPGRSSAHDTLQAREPSGFFW